MSDKPTPKGYDERGFPVICPECYPLNPSQEDSLVLVDKDEVVVHREDLRFVLGLLRNVLGGVLPDSEDQKDQDSILVLERTLES